MVKLRQIRHLLDVNTEQLIIELDDKIKKLRQYNKKKQAKAVNPAVDAWKWARLHPEAWQVICGTGGQNGTKLSLEQYNQVAYQLIRDDMKDLHAVLHARFVEQHKMNW